MTWPHATDYNAAVQNPQLCFRDEDLRQGQAVSDPLGLPRPHSGSFADVYQLQGGDGINWAVKCFTRPVAGLHPRYHAISEHLRQTQRAFMVEFHFLDEGIRIHGQWYPLVKMRWVEGFRLNEFVREQLNKPLLLDRLAQMWVRLAQELRDANIAHGDLQHGNVLLVPGSKSSSLALRLIDYDGMYVPALADRPSGEVGHPNYQHPQRLREGGYHRHMDRFAHLLIYTALRCIRVGGEELWQRYDNMENLLFREEDFRQPGKSRLLRELWDIDDRDTSNLVGHLLLASQGPLSVVPTLDELLDDSGVRPLSDWQEARINDLLDERTYRVAENAKPKAAVRRARTTVLAAAAPTVTTSALTDTQPITLDAPTGETPVPPKKTGETPVPPKKTGETPVPPGLQTERRSDAEIDLDAQPPPPMPKKPFDAATLADPLVSILSRPGWLAVLGTLALASFLVVNVLVWSSAKQPETEAAIVRRPALADLNNVVLKMGYRKTIHLSVERGDCREPLILRLDDLPDELKAPEDRKASVLTLAAEEDTIALPLLAPLGIGPPRRAVHVSLWEGDDKVDEKTFHLSVQPIPCPLLKAPDNISCRAGDSAVFAFVVDRHDCREPLRVQLVGLPPEVRQESAAAGDPDTPSIKLTVAAGLAPQVIPLHVLLRLGDAVADRKALALTIEKEPPPKFREGPPKVRLKNKTPDSLSVDEGEKGELRVLLDRRGYRGDVEVRLEDLPNGATAAPAHVPAAKDSAILTVETNAAAEKGAHQVKLLVQVNQETLDERAITLTVQPSRKQQENVHFHTVDHMELAGTLYHGWKGKKGMTVLMLHDLGRSRGTPGWRRLAEALQAEGHTVLTFDFRGHGDSTKVSKKFWAYSVNKHLPYGSDQKRRNQLTADHLPTNYRPWLIEDIAAARTYLDVRHDEPDGPVNTFNLVVIGAGQASALGSLWLATERFRFNAADVGDKIMLLRPEKLSIRQAVWLGMADPLKLNPFGIHSWLRDAHAKPVVPITFIFGEDDPDSVNLLAEPIRKKWGKELVIPNVRLSGQELLDEDTSTAWRIQRYLVTTLQELPPEGWLPRHIKKLHSYWALPVSGSSEMRLFITAKHPGQEMLSAVPMRQLGIPVDGAPEVTGVLQKLSKH
ncbi:MAG TPA: hypothetical protein VMG10_29615 [Gemmataceae bacterium]|nr:hypothetical protein [Gemmataceae bacterium]